PKTRCRLPFAGKDLLSAPAFRTCPLAGTAQPLLRVGSQDTNPCFQIPFPRGVTSAMSSAARRRSRRCPARPSPSATTGQRSIPPCCQERGFQTPCEPTAHVSFPSDSAWFCFRLFRPTAHRRVLCRPIPLLGILP